MPDKPTLKDVRLFCSKLVIDGEQIELPRRERNPVLLVLGLGGCLYGLGAILYGGIVYWALHPALTQMQLLIANWPWFLSGTVCTIGGYSVLIPQLERKSDPDPDH